VREFSPVEFTVVKPLELPPDYPKDVTNLSQVCVVGVFDETKWSISAVQYHRLTEKDPPQPILGLIETATACDRESAFDTSVRWIEESEVTGWVPDRTSLTDRYPERVVRNLMFGRLLFERKATVPEPAATASEQSLPTRVVRRAGTGLLDRMLYPR